MTPISQDKPELGDVVTSSGLVVGRKYFVRYRSETHKLDREACMVFLDEDAESFYFRLRPWVGTQHMPKSWAKSFLQAPAAEPVYTDKKVREWPKNPH